MTQKARPLEAQGFPVPNLCSYFGFSTAAWAFNVLFRIDDLAQKFEVAFESAPAFFCQPLVRVPGTTDYLQQILAPKPLGNGS